VYDAPVSFFSGNPSQGLMEPAFMELLGSVPTTWDETKVLEGRVGDYIITARRKGGDWFIGGMTDWEARSFDLRLDFLGAGNFSALLCTDGINAATYPADYRIENFTFRKNEPLRVQMAPGGGFLLRLTAQN
jgi:alpha-glucosidase